VRHAGRLCFSVVAQPLSVAEHTYNIDIYNVDI